MATADLAAAELTREQLLAIKAKLVETDGIPLETSWHRAAIALMIDCLSWYWHPRSDFYLAGNMFIYYNTPTFPLNKKKYRGPDFFYVDGSYGRDYWWVIEEGGKYPNLIVELLSKSTAKTDRTIRKDLYEQVFKTPEYFHFDFRKEELVGWRLHNGVYQAILANKRGWMWREQLQLWLGTGKGNYSGGWTNTTWLRFYDDSGKMIPTQAEDLAAKAAGLVAKADDLAAENARLKALLSEKAGPKNGKGS